MHECRDIQPLLSAHVDGSLDDAAVAVVVAHLETCAACRGLASDLAQIRRVARELGPMEPPAHVWLEIAGRMRMDDARATAADAGRARWAPVWTWAGLTAALVVVTLGLAVLQRTATPAPAPGGNAAVTDSVETMTDELNMAAEHYERAIAELQTLASGSAPAVDAETASAVTRDLRAVDDAIAESRAALAANPGSEPARDSLFDALRRKVAVLEATVNLVNEMRLGNQEGAARAAVTLGRKS